MKIITRRFKFFCFNKEVKFLFVATDRNKENTKVKFDFFDQDFNHLPIKNGYENASEPIKKPKNFDLMKELASKLSADIPQVRVDFYEVNNRVYFGEMTLYHFGGMVPQGR